MKRLVTPLLVVLLLSAPTESAAQETIVSMIRRAESLYERSDYRLGLKTCLAIIDRTEATTSQRARAFLYVGVFYTELGRHPQAVNAFVEVLRYKPAFRMPPAVKGARPSYPTVRRNFAQALAATKAPGPAFHGNANKGPLVAGMYGIDMTGVPRARRLKLRLERFLYAQLAARGTYRLVAPKRIASAISKLRKRSYKHCYARSCQVAIGQRLAAQASINTMLFRIGRRCLGTITLYDLKSGTTRSAATAEGSCTERGLLKIVRRLANELG